MRSLFGSALVVAAMILVGCQSNKSADVCPKCPGVQTEHCDKCAPKSADACGHCPGVQTADADGKCPMCKGMTVDGKCTVCDAKKM